MFTSEGVDSEEVIVRPQHDAGWRVELPHAEYLFIVIVADEAQAVRLARQLRPTSSIRILPAHEVPHSSVIV